MIDPEDEAWVGDRVRRAAHLRRARTGGYGRWGQVTPAEVVAFISSDSDVGDELGNPDQLRQIVQDLLGGARQTVPVALLDPLARFFEVTAAFFVPGEQATRAERDLLYALLADLGGGAPLVCRTVDSDYNAAVTAALEVLRERPDLL